MAAFPFWYLALPSYLAFIVAGRTRLLFPNHKDTKPPRLNKKKHYIIQITCLAKRP